MKKVCLFEETLLPSHRFINFCFHWFSGGLDVQGVLPEVLIFNGPVPEDDDDGVWAQERGDRPLPDPLPARVFGRLLPDDHLPSTSEMHPTIPRVLIVTSPFHDAPMEILDNAELRSFVGKVRSIWTYSFAVHDLTFFPSPCAQIIFKGGALAGGPLALHFCILLTYLLSLPPRFFFLQSRGRVIVGRSSKAWAQT